MVRLFIAFFLLVSSPIWGQGYKITLNLPEAAGEKVSLAYYYISRIYVRDTCRLDENGTGILEGDTLMPQSLCKIYVSKSKNFDFLLGEDQQFSFSGSSFHLPDIKVEGAPETKAFMDYLVLLEDIKKRGAELDKEEKATSDEVKKEAIKTQKIKIRDEMYSYWEKVKNELPGSFVSKFLYANDVPSLDIKTLPKEIQENDSLLLIERFNYQHQHFWDNFDYTDERLLYTPFYKSKLDTWFNKVLYPSYDSVKPYVYDFLKKVKPNKRIFQYATSFFLNSSINSKVMGMDALFIDIANDYYLSGEAFWATKSALEKIKENVLFIENNLIGKTAPDLTLESFDGEFYNLHQIESELTFLLIYEPNCSHCKVFMPEFYKKVYLPYKDKGLKVFAIYSMDNKEEWGAFLTKHNMFDWINVWDEHHASRFKILYDARKTPGVYALDKNKKIIAKKLSIKGSKEIISNTFD